MVERKYENYIPIGINEGGIIIKGLTTCNVFAELLKWLVKKLFNTPLQTHVKVERSKIQELYTSINVDLLLTFPVVLCINLSMFSECKITLNFYSVIFGFNYSTSNKSADNWCHFKSPSV